MASASQNHELDHDSQITSISSIKYINTATTLIYLNLPPHISSSEQKDFAYLASQFCVIINP